MMMMMMSMQGQISYDSAIVAVDKTVLANYPSLVHLVCISHNAILTMRLDSFSTFLELFV